jgi:Domain of unknown function (DUF4431)
MKYFIFYILIFLGSCTAYTSKSKPIEKCFNYEPEKVQLEGQLYEKMFPGPPNYTDIKEGDKKEVYWLIKIPNGFCVNNTADDWAGKLVNQTDVQLVIMPELIDWYETKKSLLEQKVIVNGTLFPQMSGHHRTQVLINVESLEKAHE